MKPQICLFRSLMFIITLLATFTVSAQEQQTEVEKSLTPKFGFKGGVNLASMYVDDVEDEVFKVGVNAGFLAKIPLIRGISVQPELLFSSKGTKVTYNNLFGRGEYRFNLNYVEMPVMAVVNVAKKLNLHAGGYAAYLVNANVKDVGNDGTVYDVTQLDADDFNRLDYGLVGGLGIDVDNFTIGARYNYGLKEVAKAASSGYTKDSKNGVISLYLGFGF